MIIVLTMLPSRKFLTLHVQMSKFLTSNFLTLEFPDDRIPDVVKYLVAA